MNPPEAMSLSLTAKATMIFFLIIIIIVVVVICGWLP